MYVGLCISSSFGMSQRDTIIGFKLTAKELDDALSSAGPWFA